MNRYNKRNFFHGKKAVEKDLGSIELTVDGVAFGGKGLAKKDGKIYFVKGAVPGDEVICKLEKVKKNFAEGFIHRFIKKAESRQKSGCMHYGECGGCQWLGVDYSKQLTWKKDFIYSALRRLAGCQDVEVEVIGSPHIYQYRSRILVRVHAGAEGVIKYGFFKMRSKELIDMSFCKITSPKINKFLSQLRCFKSIEMSNSKFRMEIQEIPSADSDCKSLFVVLTPADGKDQNLSPILGFLKKDPMVAWVGKSSETAKCEPILFEKDLGVEFYVSAGQFYQVNLEHNKILRRLVLDKISAIKPSSIYDVFCGSGNLSIPLAMHVDSIIGVEVNSRSIANAKITVDKNYFAKTKDIRFYAEDAAKMNTRILEEGKKFDLIILDPPREGIRDGVEKLASMGAGDILYVSCDPMTLARDLGEFILNGYRIIEYKALDFFPQTYHVESFVHLSKVK